MGSWLSIAKANLRRLNRFKPYLRWVILGLTVFFLMRTLKEHWRSAIAIQIQPIGWTSLVVALGITLLAHIWAGWVWGWILQDLSQPVTGFWGVQTYLTTNIAKYLPGNIWHLQGRVWVAKSAGISLKIATFGVLLEPLFMAAAALLIIFGTLGLTHWAIKVGSLTLLLLVVHPKILNRILHQLAQLKFSRSSSDSEQSGRSQLKKQLENRTAPNYPNAEQPAEPNLSHTSRPQFQHYPFRLLFGELGFLSLRSLGFLLTVLALHPLRWSEWHEISRLIGTFNLAWLLGFVVPGAPGGIGVFEATAIALLRSSYPPGLVLSVVAVYRLVNTVAEAMGAGLVWLDESVNTGKMNL